MTRSSLKASLKLWTRRAVDARKEWHAAEASENNRTTPESKARAHVRRVKAFYALVAAKAKVARRKRQLQARTPLRERALAEAVALRGTLEQGGNNRGPVVDQIIKANAGALGEPWCGDFVAYVYRKAGSKLVTRSWAAVRLLLAGSTVRELRNVRPGDIVRYDFSGPGSLSHTGLFQKWLVFGSSFHAIEGNTGTSGASSDGVGDGVHQRVRLVSQVHDFRRVAR